MVPLSTKLKVAEPNPPRKKPKKRKTKRRLITMFMSKKKIMTTTMDMNMSFNRRRSGQCILLHLNGKIIGKRSTESSN
jgi:hypothetical protein